MIRKLLNHARHWWQSSVTGRFVSRDYAKANPDTTEEKER